VSRDDHNGDRRDGHRNEHEHRDGLHDGLVRERELPKLHVDGHKNSGELM
jgi:hypothetical protein